MLKLPMKVVFFALCFICLDAHAQLFNYAKVFYIYTSNNISGESKLFAINVSKDIVDGSNLEFFTHLKNTDEEFDITTFQLDILQCRGDNCTIRASVFSPKLGSISTHKTYSRKDHKKFELTQEDSSGSIMTVMSATEWKDYSRRHQINLPMWEEADDPSTCGTKDYCYRKK